MEKGGWGKIKKDIFFFSLIILSHVAQKKKMKKKGGRRDGDFLCDYRTLLHFLSLFFV